MQLEALDEKYFLAINQLPHPKFANMVFTVIHYTTNYGLIYYPILLTLLFVPNIGLRNFSEIALTVGIITSVIVELIIKKIVKRKRPYTQIKNAIIVIPTPHSYSFPSGQASIAVGLAAISLLLYPGSNWSYLALCWAILVCFDRIYVGHHYPADVFTGALLSLIIAIICFIMRASILSLCGIVL